MKQWFVISFIVITSIAFTRVISGGEYDPVPIPPSQQRTGGDTSKGFEYLTTGDYVKGGIPINIFILGMGKDRRNYLERGGRNEKLSYEYTAIKAQNGEILVAPNCLQCHAQVFEDQLYIGLGNTLIDFSDNKKLNVQNLKRVESLLKMTAKHKYEAAKHFIDVGKTIAPYLETEVAGVNSADRLAAVLAAHRNPETFEWSDSALLPVPAINIPTDVPPWWLLHKKNAMFYNGFGRGDFGRFLMASNLLTVKDTAESAEVDSHMPDVLAYINSLRPPKYPKPIDSMLAKKGETIFIDNCKKCHGSYGEGGEYPNLLIPGAVIQTDSFHYKSNYSNPQFVEWFNKSWFTKGDHPAKLEPYEGYIAPPLDGIWITAPFFHNGSVPTLEGVLNSDKRPKYWSRNIEKPEYDYEGIGWKYKKHEQSSKGVYNTDLPGYGNYGHYFGDKLNAEERKAVIEYLKTL